MLRRRVPARSSAAAAARALPPAPTSDDALGHRGERREQSESVGEIAAHAAAAQKLSVLTAPASRASGPSSSHSAATAALCGSVTLTPSTPSAARPRMASPEIGRGDPQRDVDAVEPERLGRGVVHARRARVLDRIADHAGDARRTRDRHAGCVCWKCWKSA